MDPNLVILAGGASSRMKRAPTTPVSEELLRSARMGPKSMIPIGPGQRPLLEYLLRNARAAGYSDVVMVVSERESMIRSHFGEGVAARSRFEMDITYAAQHIPEGRTKPLGTADALLQALRRRPDWRGKKFTVCNSDNLYSTNALRLLIESPHPCAMIDYDRDALGFESNRILQFAILATDSRGYLQRIIEKPSSEQIGQIARDGGRVGVSMNIFRFEYDIIVPWLERAPLDPTRGEYELPQVIRIMVEHAPETIMTIRLAEIVPDLTSPEDLSGVRSYLERMYPETTGEAHG